MDLFAGLDGLGNSSGKKLSLAEQQKAKEQQQKGAAFDLDLLATPPASTPRYTPAQPALAANTRTNIASRQAVAELHNTSNPEDDDIFGIFNSAPKPQTKSAAQPAPPAQHPPQNKPVTNQQQSRFTETSQSRFEEPLPPRRPNNHQEPQIKQDRNVAKLVEMGFEPEDASRALKAMDNSVSGAVSWLMAEAQGLPLPKPRPSASLANADFSDIQTAATQIGASMFSKASSLFSKGKKEFNKMYSQYNHDPSKPAWMSDNIDLPPRPGRENKSKTPPMPTRPQNSQPKQSAQMPEEPTLPSRPRGDRPNRAEAFRKKQMELRNESSTPPADLLGGDSFSGSSATPPPVQSPPHSKASTPTPAAAATKQTSAEPAIDLLNISTPSVTSVSLTSTQSDLYTNSKNLGSEAFKNGDYHSAAEHYSAALNVLPNDHIFRAVMLSNRSAALLKTGDSKTALTDTEAGLKLIPNNGQGLDVEGKSMKDIWVKLVTRQAQAAEHLEKFEIAIKAWQLLLDNGQATNTVLDAKRRCVKGLNLQQNKVSEPVKPTAPKSKRRGWGTTGATPTSKEGKAALEKVKQGHAKQAEEENQKDQFRDKVSKRVESWKNGHENDLRTLLSTLQNVLWETCAWTPVSHSDLIVPKKARIVYMKAVARTHPDKISADATVEVKMIAESVFVVIQHAWETFRQENGL